MNPLVFHIVSGHAFFTGVALIVVAAVSSTHAKPIFKRITVLAFLIGLIAVVASSTAIPYWYYAIAALASLLWIASAWREKWRSWTPWVMLAAWLIAGLLELPYHFLPWLSPAASRAITVIGDSVTAGVDGDETSEIWPKLFARQHDVQVQDISHVGETAASALKRAKNQPIESPIVVVEIGGNDILGTTTTAQFASDLDALLAYLATPGRQIVVLELPLPPLYHEYGRAQRQMTAKHRAALVPKRVFLSVLAGGDATLDTVHLSQAGHQRMADAVWSVVGPALEQ